MNQTHKYQKKIKHHTTQKYLYIWPKFGRISSSAFKIWIKHGHGHWEVSLFLVYTDSTLVSIFGTYTLQSAVVMKCLSLRATFVTVSQSVRQECIECSKQSAPDRSYLLGLLSKGSFHARLDTSVIGHGWISLLFNKITHAMCPHCADKTGNEMSSIGAIAAWVWSLPDYKLKIPACSGSKPQWWQRSWNFHCLWLHVESLIIMCTACVEKQDIN